MSLSATIAAVVCRAVAGCAERTRSHLWHLALIMVGVTDWSSCQAIIIFGTSPPVDQFMFRQIFPGVFRHRGRVLPPVPVHGPPALVSHHPHAPAVLHRTWSPPSWFSAHRPGSGSGQTTRRCPPTQHCHGVQDRCSGRMRHTGMRWLDWVSRSAVRAWMHTSRLYRKQLSSILAGAVIPTSGSVVDSARLAGGTGYDVAPILFTVVGVIYAWALFRQGLMTVVPVARGLVLESIGEAVIVVAPDGRILDVNAAGDRLIRQLVSDSPKEIIDGRRGTCSDRTLPQDGLTAGSTPSAVEGHRDDTGRSGSPTSSTTTRTPWGGHL